MQYQQAYSIAIKAVEQLSPHCDLIHIAGSIRRKKAEVKDIEIVCKPQMIAIDLFHTQFERSNDFINAAHSIGQIVKGSPKNGRYVQINIPGDTNGVMLDLFIPQAHDYYRQLAIRTGSSDYAQHVIAAAWKKRGWCGTEDGLRLVSECYRAEGSKTWICTAKSPVLPPVWKNEFEFFQWLFLQYYAPEDREYSNNFLSK